MTEAALLWFGLRLAVAATAAAAAAKAATVTAAAKASRNSFRFLSPPQPFLPGAPLTVPSCKKSFFRSSFSFAV